MSKKSAKVKAPTGRVKMRADDPSASKTKKVKPYDRKFNDGWYEVVSTFNGGERITNVPEAEGYRVFLFGDIEGVVIVEVPSTMERVARDALGAALSARVRGHVLLVDEHIQFMQLRRASPQEEVKLHAYTKAQAANTAGAAPDPRQDDGARPLAPGDGGRADRLDGEEAGVGDDRHGEADGGRETRSDP